MSDNIARLPRVGELDKIRGFQSEAQLYAVGQFVKITEKAGKKTECAPMAAILEEQAEQAKAVEQAKRDPWSRTEGDAGETMFMRQAEQELREAEQRVTQGIKTLKDAGLTAITIDYALSDSAQMFVGYRDMLTGKPVETRNSDGNPVCSTLLNDAMLAKSGLIAQGGAFKDKFASETNLPAVVQGVEEGLAYLQTKFNEAGILCEIISHDFENTRQQVEQAHAAPAPVVAEQSAPTVDVTHGPVV